MKGPYELVPWIHIACRHRNRVIPQKRSKRMIDERVRVSVPRGKCANVHRETEAIE